MKITVVGTGYVGLVTGTCLADKGNDVTCIDIDAQKVERMKKGSIPIYEPGLEDVFKKNIKAGRITFSTDIKDGLKDAEVIFLALPTPPKEDGSADLSYVMGVAEQIGKLIDHYVVVVDKSTVPVGTAAIVTARIGEFTKVAFDVVSNPEFLREGFALGDFMSPDRIVIGSSSKKAARIMSELYQPFITKPSQLLIMDELSAEMTKYAANAFLATKISFMNEVANLSERLGANVDQVRLGIGADERIGNRFLQAGIGYGGSCFPKDVSALYQIGKDNNYDFKILDAVMKVNGLQKQRLADKVVAHFGEDLSDKKFALWGLAFKPDTDDIREAPALDIIQALTDRGANIIAFDPEAMDNVKLRVGDNKLLSFGDDHHAILEDADALLIATEWGHFKAADLLRVKQLLKNPVIFDGRNLFDIDEMHKQGFHYESIGRPRRELV